MFSSYGAKFHGEMTFMLIWAKKDKSVAKMGLKKYVLFFSHRAPQMPFHQETWHIFRKLIYHFLSETISSKQI